MVWILNPSREQRTVGERDKGMEENEAGSTPKVNFKGVLWANLTPTRLKMLVDNTIHGIKHPILLLLLSPLGHDNLGGGEAVPYDIKKSPNKPRKIQVWTPTWPKWYKD